MTDEEKFEKERNFLFPVIGLILLLSTGIFGYFWNDFVDTSKSIKELESDGSVLSDDHLLKGNRAIDAFFIFFISIPFWMVFLAGRTLLEWSLFDNFNYAEKMREARVWLGFGFLCIFLPFLILILYSISPYASKIQAKWFFENMMVIVAVALVVGTLGPSIQKSFKEKKVKIDKELEKEPNPLSKDELKIEIDLLENEISHLVMFLPILITLFLFIEQGDIPQKLIWLFIFCVLTILDIIWIQKKRAQKAIFLKDLRELYASNKNNGEGE